MTYSIHKGNNQKINCKTCSICQSLKSAVFKAQQNKGWNSREVSARFTKHIKKEAVLRRHLIGYQTTPTSSSRSIHIIPYYFTTIIKLFYTSNHWPNLHLLTDNASLGSTNMNLPILVMFTNKIAHFLVMGWTNSLQSRRHPEIEHYAYKLEWELGKELLLEDLLVSSLLSFLYYNNFNSKSWWARQFFYNTKKTATCVYTQT